VRSKVGPQIDSVYIDGPNPSCLGWEAQHISHRCLLLKSSFHRITGVGKVSKVAARGLSFCLLVRLDTYFRSDGGWALH